MYYREILMMVIGERRYKDFHHCVSATEVSDYYDIIKRPMSLALMLARLGSSTTQYITPSDFMDDVSLIVLLHSHLAFFF